MKKFFARVLVAALTLSLMFASAAMADLFEPELPFTPVLGRVHNTWAGLIDGKSNYNSAVFVGTYIGLESEGDEALTQEMANLELNMNISGGSFLYGLADYDNAPWFYGDEMPDGTNLVLLHGEVGDYFEFYPERNFSGSSGNEGMNDYNISWTASDTGVITNGNITLPSTIKTLKEQLASAVPYVELVRSNGTVTGVNWRIVNPDDTSKALSSVSGVTGVRIGIYFNNGNRRYRSSWTNAAPFEGTVSASSDTFNAFAEGELSSVRVDLRVGDNTQQRWHFYPISVAPGLWTAHESTAEINSDGKANYSNAKFSKIWISAFDNAYQSRLTERYSTAKGTLTISGGSGYSYGTSEENATVATALENSFKLSVFDEYCPVGGRDKEWELMDDNNQFIYFYGNAGTGAMDNLQLRVNFPSAPEMNITGTMPKFRTTSEQLSNYFPYIELIKSGNNVTGAKWRIVKADAPDTTLSGLDITRVRLDAWDKDNNHILWIRDNGDRGGNYGTQITSKFEGTAQLAAPVKVDNLDRIRARLLTFKGNHSTAYEWTFYVKESNSSSAPVEPVVPSEPVIDVNDSEVAENIVETLKELSGALGNITSKDIYSIDTVVSKSRNSEDISAEDKETIGNARYIAVLPEMKIEVEGIYVFGVSLDIPVDTLIVFHALPQTSANRTAFNAAASSESAEAYVFLDDNGGETDRVPANGHVNVAAYFEANKTYAPVIASKPEVETISSNGSSSGCNSGMFAGTLLLIAFAGFAALKRR